MTLPATGSGTTTTRSGSDRWGLAKAAELNGLPEPRHLLELKDQIPLTPDRVEAVTAIYERMRAVAIAEGEGFLEAEQALEDAFRANTVTEGSLQAMLAEIGRSRTQLRFIHLSVHLEKPSLLTEEQIARYDALRGYRPHQHRAKHEGNGPKGH